MSLSLYEPGAKKRDGPSIERIQEYLDGITFAPLWWFRALPGSLSQVVNLTAKHATLSSLAEFDVDRTMRVYAGLANGQVEVEFPSYPQGGYFMTQSASLERDVLDGWIVVSAWTTVSMSLWTKEGILKMVEWLIKAIQDHERDEFLKVDGVHVNDPHPDGPIKQLPIHESI